MKLRDRLSRLLGGADSSPRASSGGNTVIVRDLKDLTSADLNGLGETKSGAMVTPDGSLRVAAVARSVYIIAGAMGSMPAHLMEESPEDERDKTKATAHKLYRLIHKRPNRRQTAIEFRMMMQAHALLRGNGIALQIKGFDGYAKGALAAPPRTGSR